MCLPPASIGSVPKPSSTLAKSSETPACCSPPCPPQSGTLPRELFPVQTPASSIPASRQPSLPAHFRSRHHRRQMLPQQSRVRALGTNILNPKRLPCHKRKAQRRPQHLPAAFSRSSINPNHLSFSQKMRAQSSADRAHLFTLSRKPPGATCEQSPPGRSAPPSRPRSACTPPAFRRSHPRLSGIPHPPSSVCDPPA